MERVTLPGNLDALDPIGKAVMQAAQDAGLEKKAAYRLRLAVDEIATNAIVHGYEEKGLSGNLYMQVELTPAALTIMLEDEGQRFDPRTLPPPAHKDLPIAERPIGGLGVYLTLKGVDEFRYERAGQLNRNIFIMKRKEG